jgi:hypothetical protein
MVLVGVVVQQLLPPPLCREACVHRAHREGVNSWLRCGGGVTQSSSCSSLRQQSHSHPLHLPHPQYPSFPLLPTVKTVVCARIRAIRLEGISFHSTLKARLPSIIMDGRRRCSRRLGALRSRTLTFVSPPAFLKDLAVLGAWRSSLRILVTLSACEPTMAVFSTCIALHLSYSAR